jgi:carboxylesterase
MSASPLTIPTAEPFFFPGSKTGCLLIHGFTGTPKEMLWMGEYLAAQGHTVLGVRLAGHATCPEDMKRTRWSDWMASVENGWNVLRGCCDHIFVMGLSMGGALSLLTASRFPVAGVVSMSAPYSLGNDWRIPFLHRFHFLHPIVRKSGNGYFHNPDAARDHVDYPYYPTIGLAELNDLLTEMRVSLPAITAPVLLIHSHQDQTVSPENCTLIYDHLKTADRSILWVEDSSHVVTCDPERGRVFRAASDFVARITA